MMAANRPLFAGIEAGGTKFVLAVGHSPDEIIARHMIPTRDPASTLAEAAEWIAQQGQVKAIGIASFGPVELDRGAKNWGHITTTTKPGWVDCDIAGYFANHFGVPIGFDTDVNGAALGEYRYGAGENSASLAYVTVGTGIGGGIIIDGRPVYGVAHSEMGHIFPRRHVDDAGFRGICPHHGDCLEGLASGPAIDARWGMGLSQLPAAHGAHAIIADYLAQLCHNLFAVAAVETILLGGGVMKTPGLIELIQARVAELGGDYLPGRSRHRVELPRLGDNAGITGALCLAVDS